jgi:Kef-type K+ transport system membrane component KefB
MSDQYRDGRSGATWLLLYLLAALASLVGACYWTVAHAQTTRSASITFTRPAQYTDGSVIASNAAISYRVYQGLKGQAKTQVATITATATTINTGLAAGSEYCWEVTAVINDVESARSNEACKAFAFPTPETVTITVT